MEHKLVLLEKGEKEVLCVTSEWSHHLNPERVVLFHQVVEFTLRNEEHPVGFPAEHVNGGREFDVRGSRYVIDPTPIGSRVERIHPPVGLSEESCIYYCGKWIEKS